MMKSFFLLIGVTVLFGGVCAAPISGHDDFSAWSDFEGMFGKIYNDMLELDVTAICERVLEWPDFLDEEDELIFSLEDCEEFAETGRLSDFVNIHSGSKTDIDRWIDIFRAKYGFEKQVWRDEYNLQRQFALSSIWNDGDGGGIPPKMVTSPVDLVVRWNEIDDVLFGKLAEQPEFESFSESEDDIFELWAEEPAVDLWLDQSAEKKIPYGISQKHYKDGESSIVGGYAEQSRIFEEELNTNSLIAGRATTQTFDIAFTGAPMPMSTGMSVDAVASAAESTDLPEQVTILEQVPMGELEGVFAKFFLQQSATELRDAKNDGSRMAWLHKIFVEAPEQTNQEFSDNISDLLQRRFETRAKKGGLLEILPLQHFNTTLDVWIEILDEWIKVNEDFLTHVAK